jgi:RNA polymerase primary sigma factor
MIAIEQRKFEILIDQRENDEQFHQLVGLFMPVVPAIVSHRFPRVRFHKLYERSYEDLISQGNLALVKNLRSIKERNVERATVIICGAINKAVVNYVISYDSIIRKPLFWTSKPHKRSNKSLFNSLQYRAWLDWDNAKTSEDKRLARNLFCQARTNMSIETLNPEVHDQPSWSLPVLTWELEDSLKKILTEQEFFVIAHKFGFEGNMNLNQIGKELGLSRERVRQIEKRALAKIKKEFYDR